MNSENNKVLITKRQQEKLGMIYKFLRQQYPTCLTKLQHSKLFFTGDLAKTLRKNFYNTNIALQNKTAQQENLKKNDAHYKNATSKNVPTATSSSSAPKKSNKESISNIHKRIKNCQHCFLSAQRQSKEVATPPIKEKAQGRIFVVVDQISYFCQSTNIYFNDEAGEILKKIINAVNLNMHKVYCTSLLKCAGAVEVSHRLKEASICLQHFAAELNYFHPQFLIIFGEDAYRLLLPSMASTQNFNSVRGKVITAYFQADQPSGASSNTLENHSPISTAANSQNKPLQLLFTHHPRELIRDSGLKKEVWNDLKPHLNAIATAYNS